MDIKFTGKHSEITDRILEAFFKVYNQLGYGFLEKVYEKAMLIELQELGLIIERQKAIQVYYRHQPVGEFFADLEVNSCVIVELKAVSALTDEHKAQVINYLKASNVEVGLLLNFGPKAEYKRIVYDNEKKTGYHIHLSHP